MKNVYPDVDYGRDLTKNITPNFKYGEFVSSEKAMEYGIKNIPNEQCMAEVGGIRTGVKYINSTNEE